MKKIIAFLFILGTAYPSLNCMEEETLEKSFQTLAINPEYRELKDELNRRRNNSEDYIVRLMQDYSLSKDEATEEFYHSNYELDRKVRDAFLKLKNK